MRTFTSREVRPPGWAFLCVVALAACGEPAVESPDTGTGNPPTTDAGAVGAPVPDAGPNSDSLPPGDAGRAMLDAPEEETAVSVRSNPINEALAFAICLMREASAVPRSIWSLPLSEPINDIVVSWEFSAPTFAKDGTIYVTSGPLYWHWGGKRLIAVSKDGTKLWQTEAIVGEGAPLLDEERGVLYVALHTLGRTDPNPAVAAFRQSDGTKLWTYPTHGEVLSTPALGADGTIYVTSVEGQAGRTGEDDKGGWLYALSPSGALHWEMQFPRGIRNSPAIGAYGSVYVVSSWGEVIAVRPGPPPKVAWTNAAWDIGQRVATAPPVIGLNGTIYASRSHTFVAIGPSGTLIWAFNHLFFAWNTGWSTAAIGADGTIYAAAGEGSVRAFNPNGTVKWTTWGQDYLAPIVTENSIFSLTFKGEVRRLDTPTGVEGILAYVPEGLSTFTDEHLPRSMPGPIGMSPNGVMVYGNVKGTLYSLPTCLTLPTTGWPTLGGNAAHTGRVGP